MFGWIWRIVVWFLVAKFAAWIALAAVVFGGGALMGAVPSLEVPISVAVIVSWPGTLVVVFGLLWFRYTQRTRQARVPSAYTYTHARAHVQASE